jgi:hypothetical protein
VGELPKTRMREAGPPACAPRQSVIEAMEQRAYACGRRGKAKSEIPDQSRAVDPGQDRRPRTAGATIQITGGSVDIVATAEQTEKAFTAEALRARRTAEATASGQSRQKRSGRDLSYRSGRKMRPKTT